MIREAAEMIARAKDCLESADYNIKGGFLDAAANRAYYGVFDALQALMVSSGYAAKSHNGLRTLFAEHFLKTSIFPKEAGMWIAYCFEMRQQSDYDFSSRIELEETQQSVEYCRSFIDAVEKHLTAKA